MMINKITDYEKKAIDKYRFLFGKPEDAHMKEERFASTEVFLNEWAKKKQPLFELFGKELMIEEKNLQFELSEDYIKDQMRDLILESSFCKAIRELLSRLSMMDYISYYLLDPQTLAKNKFSHSDVKIKLPSGKEILVPNGCKPMKPLKKIAKDLELEEAFEEFRIQHSQILNDTILKGDLVLSIHPLDFMTMSDNASKWSSCMSWIKNGCYSTGTLEMMNSPYVVVAYLKSTKKDFSFGDFSWNNKKWRQLFIINDEIVTGVKQYPFKNTAISRACRHKLVELASKYFDANYVDTTFRTNCDNDDYYDEYGFEFRSKEYTFNFLTNAMYNDFSSITKFVGAVNTNVAKPGYITTIDYSGDACCAWCGELLDLMDNEEIFEEDCSPKGTRVCYNCVNLNYCESCGHYYFDLNAQMYEIDGKTVCRHCYENAIYAYNDMNNLHLRSNDNLILLRGKAWGSLFLYRPLLTQEFLDEIFTNATLDYFETINYWHASRSNNLTLTPAGKRLLGELD